MALSIDIAANTRLAQAQVKDLSNSLETVADSLDDVAREAAQAGGKVERELDGMGDSSKGVAREIDSAGDKIERTFKDMVDDAQKADKAISKVGDEGAQGMGKFKAASGEALDETRQNISETFSSFKGEVGDFAQLGQDIVGGLAGSGGIFTALGLGAAAAGIGVVTAEMQKQQEEAQKLRERVGGLYQGAVEDGRVYIDTMQVIAEMNSLAFDPDRADEWKRIQEDANKLSLDTYDIVAAHSGDLGKQADVQRRINDLMEDSNNYSMTGATNQKTLNADVRDLAGRWEELNKVTRETAETARQVTAATSVGLKETIVNAKDATRQVDEFGNELYTIGDKQIVVEANTKRASEDVSKFKGDLSTIPGETVSHVRVRADLTSVDTAMNALQRRANQVGALNIGMVARSGKVLY